MYQALEQLKEQRIEKIAEYAVKYQKFKTSSILEKIAKNNDVKMSKSNTELHLNCGISYLKYGKKNHSVANKFYQMIDKFVETHLQPLTPTLSEKRVCRKRDYTKKDVVLPVQKVVAETKIVTEKFEYGIKIDNRIILFDKEEEMKQFIRNMKFISDIDIQAIEVEYNKYGDSK